MGKEMFNGNRITPWIVRNKFRELVLQTYFLFFYQLKNDGRGELLGDRSNLVNGICSIVDRIFFILVSITFF